MKLTAKKQIPISLFGAVFFTAFSVIALQISLIRALTYSNYYHFTYFIISTAMLGFGISGRVLGKLQHVFMKKLDTVFTILFILYIFSIFFCYSAASSIGLNLQFIFYSSADFFKFLFYTLLFIIPFLIGAMILGLFLRAYPAESKQIYGANLLGSGTGALAPLGLLYLFPPEVLPLRISVFALAAFLFFLIPAIVRYKRKIISYVLTGVFIVAGLSAALFLRLDIDVDQYKGEHYLKLLTAQGSAELLASSWSPQGRISIYKAPSFHLNLFASLSNKAAPPPQFALCIDGEINSAILAINNQREAKMLDYTPQSIAYRISAEKKPSVLLLGEQGGANIWLAHRYGASEISVVQENPYIFKLLAVDLADQTGNLFADDSVRYFSKNKRLFLETTEQTFDIIHFSYLESLSAGSNGLYSLLEDFTFTQAALKRCLKLLNPGGVIAITRGMQFPARDNLKIITTAVQALEEYGSDDPLSHLALSRNYLAFNTLIFKDSLTLDKSSKLHNIYKTLPMDIEHLPFSQAESTQEFHKLYSADPEAKSDYSRLLNAYKSGRPEQFTEEWLFNITPPTDQRPFFNNFFKWKSLGRYAELYGQFWFRNIESGFIILIVTFFVLLIFAVLGIILPVVKSRKLHWRKTLYFLSLGFGFFFFEMFFIQKLTLLFGKPVFSSVFVLFTLLVFAGCGSIFQRKFHGDAKKRIKIATVSVCVIALILLAVLSFLSGQLLRLPLTIRIISLLILMAPFSFFLGWLFPSGLELLSDEAQIPGAWAVNGFASVLAGPLAMILFITIGLNFVFLLAVLLYFLCSLLQR